MSWNRGAEKIFGYTAEEAVGRHISLIIPAERLAEEDMVLARLRRGEKVDHFETERQTKDGRRVNISLTVSPVRDADGKVVGASKVARDITDRKRAEEMLQKSEATFRRIAGMLQRALLPEKLPDMPGVEAAVRYLPAGEGAEVGGDWYDVIPLPSGEIAIAIGDVAGRGIQAAAKMGELRSMLRAYVLEGHGPSGVIGHLNNALAGGGFATVALLYLDPTTGEIRYANAGHCPPVVIVSDGEPRFLEHGSPPLGTGLYRQTEETLAIPPGSTLVLYTDGLIEAEKDVTRGLARLRQAVGQPDSDVLRLADLILERVLGGTSLRDDVALLVLRMLPVDAERFTLRLPAVPASLPILRRHFGQWMRIAGLPEEEAFSLLVAVGEACANVIVHAYGGEEGRFEIAAVREAGSVTVTVRDSGNWRPPRDGREHQGRGLPLIRGLMDRVEISFDKGSRVKMERFLGSAQK